MVVIYATFAVAKRKPEKNFQACTGEIIDIHARFALQCLEKQNTLIYLNVIIKRLKASFIQFILFLF